MVQKTKALLKTVKNILFKYHNFFLKIFGGGCVINGAYLCLVSPCIDMESPCLNKFGSGAWELAHGVLSLCPPPPQAKSSLQ
jgi:hypothetical protein